MSYCNATSDSDSLEPRDRTRFLIAWSERTSLVWTQKHNTHGNTSGTEDTGVASIGDHLTPPEWIKIRSNQSAPISQLGQQSWGSKMGAERVVIVFWIPWMERVFCLFLLSFIGSCGYSSYDWTESEDVFRRGATTEHQLFLEIFWPSLRIHTINASCSASSGGAAGTLISLTETLQVFFCRNPDKLKQILGWNWRWLYLKLSNSG